MKDSTIRRLQRERRDRLFKLLRLARRLHLAPYSGPNAVKPVTPEDWDRAAGSLAPVNAKHSNLSVKFELWYSYVQLLRQLREGEFVSCYRPGNFETICLTVLDFPSIFVATRLLERVAPQLLPNGCAGIVRLRTKKKKRREDHPRFKGWMRNLPKYLKVLADEAMGNDVPPKLQAGGHDLGGNGSGKSVKILAKRPVQAKKKKTAPKKTLRKASGVKKSAVKKVAWAPKATRVTKAKRKA